MPALLLLDTCGTTGYVALVDADHPATPLAARTLPGRETQERLLPALAETLAEAALTAHQLAAIAIVTGPGSFTGVRIGLAAAKGLAEACTLPLLALSRLAVLAEAARPHAAGALTACIDAGRADVYTRTDGQAETMLPRSALPADATLATEDPTLHPAAIVLTPAEVQQATAALAARAFHAGVYADIALLDANYLRVPNAELALRARQAAAE